MTDLELVLVGAAAGAVLAIATKAWIDPILDRRKRKRDTRGRWLEKAVEHADAVRSRMQAVRTSVSSQRGFDPELIALDILRSMTSDDGPAPLTSVKEHVDNHSLAELVTRAEMAWMTVMLAKTDDQNQYTSEDVMHQPQFALQAYSVALSNFTGAARAELA